MEQTGIKVVTNKKNQGLIRACEKRTCDPQLRNCELGQKDQKFNVPEGQLPRFEPDGGDGGGNSDPVNPTVPDNDNPRKTPTGDGPVLIPDNPLQ
jgi:hypothetical protein